MAVEKYFLLTCTSTSLFPSVFYDLWCTCVFLRWRPPVGWSQPSSIELHRGRHARGFLHGSREIFSPHLHEDQFVSKFVLWYLIFVRIFFRWPPPMGWSQILLSFVEVDTRFLHRRRETFPPYLHEDQFVFKCVLWSLVFVRFYLGGVLLCRGVKVYWAACNLDLSFSLGVNHLHEVREYFLYANSKHRAHMHLGVSM